MKTRLTVTVCVCALVFMVCGTEVSAREAASSGAVSTEELYRSVKEMQKRSRARIEKTTQFIQRLEASLEEKDQEILELKSELEERKKDAGRMDKLSHQLDASQGRIRELEESDRERREGLDRLEQENRQKQRDIVQLNARLSDLRKTLRLQTGHLIDGQDNVEELQSRLEEQQILADKEKGQLAGQVGELKTRLEENKEEYVQALSGLKEKDRLYEDRLEKMREDHEKEYQSLNEEYARFKEKASEVTGQQEDRIRKLKEILVQSRNRARMLNDRLIYTEYKLSGREKELEERDTRIGRMQDSFDDAQKQIAFLKAKVWAQDNIARGPQAKKRFMNDVEKDRFIKHQDELIVDLKKKLALVQKDGDHGGPAVYSLRDSNPHIKIIRGLPSADGSDLDPADPEDPSASEDSSYENPDKPRDLENQIPDMFSEL